jgi:hypothetical protein
MENRPYSDIVDSPPVPEAPIYGGLRNTWKTKRSCCYLNNKGTTQCQIPLMLDRVNTMLCTIIAFIFAFHEYAIHSRLLIRNRHHPQGDVPTFCESHTEPPMANTEATDSSCFIFVAGRITMSLMHALKANFTAFFTVEHSASNPPGASFTDVPVPDKLFVCMFASPSSCLEMPPLATQVSGNTEPRNSFKDTGLSSCASFVASGERPPLAG